MNRKTRNILFMVAGAAISSFMVAGFTLYRAFRRELAIAYLRINTKGKLIDTPYGPIEYAEQGEGTPVLVIHGAGGGFDQGLLIGEIMLGNKNRIIAPSRFGYLGSPAPHVVSLKAQVDRFVGLLDVLGLDRVHVAGISAGGPPALTFAVEYPERTATLSLFSAISYQPPETISDAQRETNINRLVAFDFFYWLAVRFARSKVLELLGVSGQVQAQMSAQDQVRVSQILLNMLPIAPRLNGISIDQAYILQPKLPLNNITCPTMIVHARDDTLVSFANGEYSAALIPGAQFIPVDTGGHYLVGHYENLRPILIEFLARVQIPSTT